MPVKIKGKDMGLRVKAITQREMLETIMQLCIQNHYMINLLFERVAELSSADEARELLEEATKQSAELAERSYFSVATRIEGGERMQETIKRLMNHAGKKG